MKDEMLNLDSLTEEERDRIMSVLKRDEELRTAQDSRITDIKSEINTIRMNAVLKPGEDGNKMCRRCRDPFGYFFSTGEICPNCKFKVCKKCREYQPKGTWMCNLCFKQRQLKAMSGEWLVPSNQQKESAPELVKKSIRRKSSHQSEEDGHDQITVKRTSNAKEWESSSDCSSVGEVSSPGDTDKKRLSTLLAQNNIQTSPSHSNNNNNNNNSQHVHKISSKRYVESDSEEEEEITSQSNSVLNSSRPTFSSNSALSTGRNTSASELSDQEDGHDHVDDGNGTLHSHRSNPDFDEAGYRPHTELPDVFDLIAKSKEKSLHSPFSSMTSSPTNSTIGQRLVDLAASAENSDADYSFQDSIFTDETCHSHHSANPLFTSANLRLNANSLKKDPSNTNQINIAQSHGKRPPPLRLGSLSNSPSILSTPALDALSDKYKSLAFEKNFYQLSYSSNSPLYTPPPSSATSSVNSWGSRSSRRSCVEESISDQSTLDIGSTFDVSPLSQEESSYYSTSSLVASVHTDADVSSLHEDSGNITGTSQESSPQQTHSKNLSEISVPSINVSSVEGEEEDDSIDGLSVRSRSSTFQQTFGGLFSSLGGSRESIASYYSQAGGGSYGVVEVKGAIQFAVDYKHKTGILEIQVKQASELAAVDKKKEKSDPYVKIYLLPDRTRNGKRKTHTKKNTLDPVFDETLRFHVSKSELSNRTLWLSVWNHDRFGKNVFLGEVTLPLNYYTFTSLPQWHTLQDKEEMDPSVMTYKGDLIISLKYIPLENLKDVKDPKDKKKKEIQPKEGQLCVLIKSAKNLTAVRSNGYSDPFCKGYILPDKGKHIKQKTTVVKRTLSPKWNYQFTFENVSFEELPERCIELTVWDHDRFSSNDFLGGARLNLGLGQAQKKDVDWMDARGEEISIWQTMIEQPNVWVDATLTLRPNMDKVE